MLGGGLGKGWGAENTMDFIDLDGEVEGWKICYWPRWKMMMPCSVGQCLDA